MLRSRNYAPSVALSPYIARHYVFSVDAPNGFELVDKLLAETAFIRILLRGDWSAEVAPGNWSNVGPMVFFGPNSRPLTVRVRGGFNVVGIAIRPGGWRALFEQGAATYTDQMLPLADLCGDVATGLYAKIVTTGLEDDLAITAAIEHCFLELLTRRGHRPADPAMLAFEMIARGESTIMARDAAARIGLSARQLERQCLNHFGLSPKTVLRRSRFLDMASAMRGLSKPNEEELAGLRYYDQSHLSREFRRFIGMTPGQFAQTPTPLLTAGLELRNLRKLDDLSQQ